MTLGNGTSANNHVTEDCFTRFDAFSLLLCQCVVMEEEESTPTALQTVDPEVRAYVYSLVSAVCMPDSELNAC